MKRILSLVLTMGIFLSLIVPTTSVGAVSGNTLEVNTTNTVAGGASSVSSSGAVMAGTPSANLATNPSTLTYTFNVAEDGVYTVYWTRRQTAAASGGAQILRIDVDGTNLVENFPVNDIALGQLGSDDYVKEALLRDVVLTKGTHTLKMLNTNYYSYNTNVSQLSWEKTAPMPDEIVVEAESSGASSSMIRIAGNAATPSDSAYVDSNYGYLYKGPSTLTFDFEVEDAGTYSIYWTNTIGTEQLGFAASGGAQHIKIDVDGSTVVENFRANDLADGKTYSADFKTEAIATNVTLSSGPHTLTLTNSCEYYFTNTIKEIILLNELDASAVHVAGSTATASDSASVDSNYAYLNRGPSALNFSFEVDDAGTYTIYWVNTIGNESVGYGASGGAQYVKVDVDGSTVVERFKANDTDGGKTYTADFKMEAIATNVTLGSGPHTLTLTNSHTYYFTNTIKEIIICKSESSELSPIVFPDNGRIVMQTYRGNKVTYDVNVPNSGLYEVSALVKETSNYRVSIATEDSQAYKGYNRWAYESTALGSYRKVSLGQLKLTRGTNVVTLTNLESELSALGTFAFDKLCFNRVRMFGENNVELPAIYYSDRYDGTAESETQIIVTGDTMVYPFYVSADGFYKLTMTAKATKDSFVTITTDSGNYAKRMIPKGNSMTGVSTWIKLKEGFTNLELTCDGLVTFSDILLEYATPNNSVCTALNSAANAAAAKKILKENAAALLFDVDDVTKNLLNTDSIFSLMYGQSFADVTEVSNTFAQLVYNSISAPDVILKKNGIAIKALQSGNLSVEVNTKNVAAGKVLAALYKDGKLQLAKSNDVGTTKTTLTLGNVTISEGSWELKVFCFTNLDQLVPVAIFTNQKTIYVKVNGNDSKDGSSWENAVKTIERAQELARELAKTSTGDVVVQFGTGVFTLNDTLTFNNADSGRGGRVIYRGSQDGETVISGGTQVTGWTEASGMSGVYVADTEVTEARTLYVNDWPAQRARSKYVYRGLEYWVDESVAVDATHIDDGFTVSKHNFPIIEKPEDLEIVWRMLWVHQRTPVADIVDNDTATKLIKMDQPYWNWARTSLSEYTRPRIISSRIYTDENGTEHTQSSPMPFYLENDINLLDEEGEFYFDKDTGKVYYYPFASEKSAFDDGTAETYLGTTEIMMKVEGESKYNKVKNLTFEDISFRHGAWNEVSTTGKRTSQADKLSSGPNQWSEPTGGRILPAQLQFTFADGIEIKNCEFTCLGSSAVSFLDSVSNVLIEGNTFHDISGGGVIIGYWDIQHDGYINSEKSHNFEITNNVFRRIGTEFSDTCGVSVFYADDVNIHHNQFKDLPYTGITAGWGWQVYANTPDKATCKNLQVKNNSFEDVMQKTSDGGAVYVLGNMNNAMISENYIDGSIYGNGGIYFDGGSTYATAENNVVLNVVRWFKKNAPGNHNYAKNNFTNMNQANDADSFHPAENVTITGTTYLASADLSSSPVALAIKNAAGLSAEFAHLADGLDYPSWRTNFLMAEPDYYFVGECTPVDMRAWTNYADNLKLPADGYANSGYPNLAGPRDFRMSDSDHADEIVLGSGDWVEYKVNIPADGSYTLSIELSAAGSDPERGVKIYDGYRWFLSQPIATLKATVKVPGEYVSYEHVHTSKINLSAGEHTIRVTGYGHAVIVGSFKFDDGVQRTQNDALFDDGRVTQR